MCGSTDILNMAELSGRKAQGAWCAAALEQCLREVKEKVLEGGIEQLQLTGELWKAVQ